MPGVDSRDIIYAKGEGVYGLAAKTMIRVGYLFDWPALGHKRWAHLWDDEGDREALVAFAVGLGLKPGWLQVQRRRYPEIVYHFDLVPSKHRLAIQRGAVLTNELDYWRGKVANGQTS